MHTSHLLSRTAPLALAALLGTGAAQAQDGAGVCRVAPIAADNPAVNTAAPFGDAANSGATWASPMTLQQALATAGCQQIHLRQGVYKPVAPANPAAVTDAERRASFAITRPLQLLGGFTGNAAAPAERVLKARNTVLSGDLGGDDTGANASGGITEGLYKTVAGWSNNSYHVVTIGGLNSSASVGSPYTADDTLPSYTLIEGVTITGGYAQNSGASSHPDYSGGGLFCNGAGAGSVCSPRIRHVYFTGNQAWRGGALYLQAHGGTSSPVISHTTFNGNEAQAGGEGGAIYSMVYRGGTASAEISNSTFFDNRAGNGGAIYGRAYSYVFDPGDGPILSPRIVHSTFTQNAATGRGGGLAFFTTVDDGGHTGNPPPNPVSEPRITASVLWGNTASSGNATYAQVYWGTGGVPTLQNNTIQPTSGTYGNPLLGPLQDNGGPTPTVLPGTGSPAIDAVPCNASGTTITSDQRGMARPQGSTCDQGATEVGPQASAPLNLAATTRNGTVDLTWQPPHSQGHSAITGYTVTATLGGVTVGTCTVTATACTISGLSNGTAYQFTATATNGAGAGVPSAPLTATPQFRATDPCASTTVLHAAPAAAGLANGSSWANAATLQGALALAHAATDPGQCQEIRIRQGVYKPTDVPDRAASFAIQRPLRLLGGYTGNPAVPAERELKASNTVLSGDIDDNDLGTAANGGITAVARFNSNGSEAAGNQLKGDNSQHVVSIGGVTGDTAVGGPYTFDDSLASYTLIEGLTITGGLATHAPSNYGGGLYCNARGPGAVCSPAIRHVTFSGNAASSGGALYNGGYKAVSVVAGGTSSPDISHSTFSGNAATDKGGAIYNLAYYGTSSPTIRHSTFSGNMAAFGGAIANWSNVSNFHAGTAPTTASPDIRHTTFSGNQALRGRAIDSDKGDGATSTPRITASIVWGNTSFGGVTTVQINNGTGTTTTVESSIVQGSWAGTGILNADPQLSLLQDNGGPTPTMLPAPGGAAVNAVACGAGAADDQRGVARPQGAGATPCDLGAVEYQYSGGAAVALHPLSVDLAPEPGAGGSVGGQGAAFTTHYEAGSTATLIAVPNAASQFNGWAGACSGTGACTVTMNQARSVTASFGLVSFPITIDVTNPAGGSVASCAASAAQASTYTCTPTVNPGHSVVFTGCTSVSGDTCTIDNVQAPATIGVTFAPALYWVNARVHGLTGGQKATISINGAPIGQPVDNNEWTGATIAHGSAYNVTATALHHTCTPPAASGTATANVDYEFTCTPVKYNLSGTITGLTGGGVTLQLNGFSPTPTGGSFTFHNRLTYNQPYALTVPTQPAGHTCTVSPNGSGASATGDVTGVVVSCVPAAHTVSGTITGLAGGAQVTLRNNGAGGQTLGNGPFSFATSYGSAYAITTTSDPAGHTCTVTGGNGTAAGDVSGVQVNCTAGTYAITGTPLPAIGGSVACTAAPVAYGGSAQCTATANAGWRFTAFDAASGCTQANGTTCEINPVQAAHTVTARFEPHFEGTTVPGTGTGGTGSATFTGGGPACRFDTSATAFEPAPATPPQGATLPQGMFRFKLVGCDTSTVTLRVTWPQPIAGYTKYGKASANATDDSYFAPADLDFSSGHTATFTVQDGQLGDDDWAENGEIVDPTGPTAAAGPGPGPGGAQPIPTLGEWGLLLLSGLLGLLGLRRFQAKSASSA